MAFLIELLLGAIVIVTIAIFAFKKDLLNESGTLMAIIAGFIVFSFPASLIPGWIWFALLALFFILSSAVTRFRKIEKEQVNQEFAKGGVRDAMQVFANGAGAALFAVIYRFYPSEVIFLGFAVTLATVNADTWATELGILSKVKPYLITNLKRVERGASGAVSAFGTLAALAGSIAIALIAVLLINLTIPIDVFAKFPLGVFGFIFIVSICGLLGSLIDSFMGATWQVMYYCEKCKKETERRIHKCGAKTVYKKGAKWFDNDLVNLLSSLVAALVGIAIYFLLKMM